MLPAHAHELVVPDHLMPKVSGLALARRIRVAHLPLPVIPASRKLGEADFAHLSHAPWARLDAFILQPSTDAELIDAAHNLLPGSGSAPVTGEPRSPEQSVGEQPRLPASIFPVQSFPDDVPHVME